MKRYKFYSTGSNTEFYYKIDCSQLLEFDYIFHIFDIIHYNSTDNYILNKFIDDTIPNLLEQGDTNSTAFYFANRRIENPLVCKILKYQKYPDSIIQNYFSYLRDTNLGEQTDVFYTLKKILEKYLFLTPLIPSDIDREELNDLGITVAEYNLLQGFIHSSSSELATLFGYYVDLWDGSKNEELLDYFQKRLHQSNLEAQESEEDAYFYDLERVNHH